jgi:DNA-binding CsgD family transcriptional regulator/DNA-binding transcriptional ArsR family regulator
VRTSGAPSKGQDFLVGRQREQLELRNLLRALRERRGGLVLVSGEAGIGKTSLVSAFIAEASGEGVQVFTGHCYDLETTPPYGPWLNSDILDSPNPAEAVPSRQVATLTPERQRVLDFLAEHGPARPRDVAAALGVSANAATQTLRRLLGENHVTQPSYGKYAATSLVDSEPSGAGDLINGDSVRSSVFPSLDRQPGLSQRGTQRNLFEDVGNHIAARSLERPIVLVLEDMHWADQASVELLRFVARELPNAPVLVIVTYRDVDLSPGQSLYRYLPYIVRETRAVRIALRRLSAPDIRNLVAGRYGLPADDEDRLLDHLQRYTDGNPFFVHEVLLTMEQGLQLIPDDGVWRLADLSEIQVPPLVQQVIDGRLERLDEDVYQLLQIAAVIGSDVPISLLQEVSGAADDAVLHAIEQAVDAQLLEVLPGRPVVRFRHALMREALYHSLLALRSQMWHRRIAEVLSQQPNADLDAVAHHFRQGIDSQGVEWLIRAGERAARQFDWLGAVERFRSALDFPVGSPATDSHRAWLHFHIGMLSRRSNTDASLVSLRSALEIAAQEDDRFLQGLATTALGLAHCIIGEIGLGLSYLESGVEMLESLDADDLERLIRARARDDPLFVRLPLPAPASQRGILVHWLAVSGQYAAAIEMGTAFAERIPRQTSATGPFHGDDYYDAFMGLGHAYSIVGQTEPAVAALSRVRAGYSTDEQLPIHYLLYELDHLIEFNLDQSSERARVEQLVATVWQSHRGMWLSQIPEVYRSPRLLFWYGEWDAAEQMARGWDTTRRTTIARIASVALGRIALYRGNVDDAWAWARTAFDNQRESAFGNSWCELILHAHGLAAELSLHAGDFEGFQRSLHAHGDLLERSGAQVGRAQHYLMHSRYHQLLGNQERALAYAEQALSFATKPHRPIPRLLSHRAVGSLLTRDGRYTEAEEHLLASYDLTVRCATRYETAVTCAAQARLMISTGRFAAARHKLVEARAVATYLGAYPLLQELTELTEFLAEAEGRRAVPGGLSSRELDVLQLVARGLTDAEIAEKLFLSPRTVSGHLQSIYNKLGISSRTAATAYAYTHDLV